MPQVNAASMFPTSLLATAVPHPVATLPVPTLDDAQGLLYDGCPDPELELPGQTPLLTVGAQHEQGVQASLAVRQHGGVVGAVVVYGVLGAQALQTPDGHYVQVRLAWPVERAWGAGQCEFLKERTRVHCIEQYVRVALTLAAQVAQPGATPVLQFEGEWAAHADSLRRRIAARFVERFLGLSSARLRN